MQQKKREKKDFFIYWEVKETRFYSWNSADSVMLKLDQKK